MAFMLPTKPGSMPISPMMGRMPPIPRPPPPGGPPSMPTPISGPIGPPIGPIGLMPGRRGGPPIMPRGTGPGPPPPPPPPAALTSFMAAQRESLESVLTDDRNGG